MSEGFVAGSPSMIEVLGRMERVTALDTTVLVSGESGTGKEVVARWLHDRHPRRAGRPFVCVNCGAIPDSLLESELFGHLKGSFTGADRDRQGKFEQAQGGTIFLDEIGTMSPDAQVRLLRVLQEREVCPVGASTARPVDVRVIAATNENLEAMTADGRFRLDLYYRLAVYPIALPPLRERTRDIPELATTFVGRTAERHGRDDVPRLSDRAIEALVGHDWPGNVRELENCIEYGMIQSAGRSTIEVADLPEPLAGNAGSARRCYPGAVVTEAGLSFRSAITTLERELILQSMALASGNKARAAELLRLKRTTFLEKLRRIEDDQAVIAAQPDRSSADADASLSRLP